MPLELSKSLRDGVGLVRRGLGAVRAILFALCSVRPLSPRVLRLDRCPDDSNRGSLDHIHDSYWKLV